MDIKDKAKELCDCHHKCHDTKDCVVEDEALLLINQDKSNNFDVKSNNELFKQALVEGVSRHFDKIIEQEKQIEEIAKYLCKSYSPYCSMCPDCYAEEEATALYNAGYRKQSEGEWIGEADGYADGELVYDVWHCSECNHCIDDGTDDADLLPNFCPNCGAKMKGGE